MVNIFSAILQAARGYDLDDAFSYDTNKVVKIRDRKLGFLYYTFWLGILVYVILALFYSQNFIQLESPVGTVSIWTEERPEFETVTTGEFYCNNATYDYYYDQINCWYAEDVGCRKEHMRYMFRHATTNEKSLITVEFNSSTEGNGFCTSDFTFLPGVEHLDLIIEHAFVSKKAGLRRKNLACDLVDTNGDVVRTIASGRPIRLSVTEALALAGTGLDQKQVIGSTYEDGTEAFLRLTGAIILVELTYENYDRPFVISHDDISCKASFALSPGQWGIIDQIQQGDTYLTRMGLQFSFLTVGEIGRFSFVALMTTLVSAAVLFKTSTTIVDFVALFILKRRYLYRTAKYEWTGDYHDSRGKDIFDVVAEDHIPVTRRDLRAVMDNLIATLRKERVKKGRMTLKNFKAKFNEDDLLPQRRGLWGDCRCKRPKVPKADKKAVKKPKIDLIEWEDLVRGNGTEQWGLYDYRQRSLCQRTFHVFQEGLGFNVDSERYQGEGKSNRHLQPQEVASPATIDISSHQGDDDDDEGPDSPASPSPAPKQEATKPEPTSTAGTDVEQKGSAAALQG